MGREELKWRQLAHHQLMSYKGFILVHTVKLKPIIKAQISRKLVTSGVSDVAIATVHSEKTLQCTPRKTRMKKMIMIIIISMNIERIDGFWQAPEIDFRYETESRKVMVGLQI